MNSRRIAIIGSTSHIAKGLIYNFSITGDYELFLFARSLKSVENFLNLIKYKGKYFLKTFSEFSKSKYDVIINCVGIGSSVDIKNKISACFRLTEAFDNLVLDYLETHLDSLYINLSSGAVYGKDFSEPVNTSTCSKWDINNITESDYYGIAKLNSEAKHRALINLKIVDLRIFGYFSRFINLKSRFLLTEIISCIKDGREFITGNENIVRDYIHPRDLFSLIEKCIQKYSVNDAFDAFSLKPITKFEIIHYFASEYGLRYIVKDDAKVSSLTGGKVNYYSNNKSALNISYVPQFSSADCIIQESRELLN